MKKYFVYVLISSLAAGTLFAGELDTKMGKMAKKFVDAYSSKTGTVALAPMAIFPFQADENLTKRRVNFAASEVFTSQILKTGKFKVVERTDLEKVLKEQKLGLSGAIETDKAVDVGKLVGAKLLVMGSINRLGGSYQISVRLVDAETSEIITSEYAEVPVKTFEQETKLYMPYVPEKEAIGLYGVFEINPVNLQLTSVLSAAPVRYTYLNPITNTTETVAFNTTWNNSTLLYDNSGSNFGFGVKYSPCSWLMIDAGYTPSLSTTQNLYNSSVFINDSAYLYRDAPEGQNAHLTYTENTIQGGVSGMYKISKKLRAFFGAGVTQYTINYAVAGNFGITGTYYYNGGAPYYIEFNRTVFHNLNNYSMPTTTQNTKVPQDTDMIFSFNDTVLVPYGKIGLEWKPQERLGISVFCTMPFGSLDETFFMNTQADFVSQNSASTVVLGKTTSKLFELTDNESPQLNIAVSLYF